MMDDEKWFERVKKALQKGNVVKYAAVSVNCKGYSRRCCRGFFGCFCGLSPRFWGTIWSYFNHIDALLAMLYS